MLTGVGVTSATISPASAPTDFRAPCWRLVNSRNCHRAEWNIESLTAKEARSIDFLGQPQSRARVGSEISAATYEQSVLS